MVCVGGSSMEKFGFPGRTIAYPKEAGMQVEVFEGIDPDFSVDTVMCGADSYPCEQGFVPEEMEQRLKCCCYGLDVNFQSS